MSYQCSKGISEMSIFTESVLQGMGSLSMAPLPIQRRPLKSRVCSSVAVRISEFKEINLVGTEVFSSSPWSMDWFAIGNDIRLGAVRFQLGAEVNGKKESDQSGQSKSD